MFVFIELQSVLLEVKLPYDPVCPSFVRSVSWSAGRLVSLSQFTERAGSYTLMLLSKHLLKKGSWESFLDYITKGYPRLDL